MTCNDTELIGYNGVHVTDPACEALIDKMYVEIGGFYEYSLYDRCWY